MISYKEKLQLQKIYYASKGLLDFEHSRSRGYEIGTTKERGVGGGGGGFIHQTMRLEMIAFQYIAPCNIHFL